MSEPHQRTKSGKLRKGRGQGYTSESTKGTYEKQVVYTGIENAVELVCKHNEDEYSTYLQTPTDLCNTQVEILEKITAGCSITDPNAIDRSFRKTWNIGAWHIGNKISISINIKQPNISGCWSVIKRLDPKSIQPIADKYTSENLEKSTCTITPSTNNTQVKGRWTPNIIDDLIYNRLVSKEDIEIVGLNIGQTSLFCWMVLNTESKYLCLFTRDAINITVRYLPEWCMDINETSSGGSTTLKIKSPQIQNDASQLSISNSGGLQYQGRPENIPKLFEALSIAIHSIIESIHLRLFLDSLEYKIVDI